jgi:hypothetical protein
MKRNQVATGPLWPFFGTFEQKKVDDGRPANRLMPGSRDLLPWLCMKVIKRDGAISSYCLNMNKAEKVNLAFYYFPSRRQQCNLGPYAK